MKLESPAFRHGECQPLSPRPICQRLPPRTALPLGIVETSRDVAAEVRSIDVWFQPTPNPSQSHPPLGLLGKLARTPALFEPFRNPITPSEVRSCVGKLFDVCAQQERQAKREKRRITTEELPRLWILTPTASQTVLTGFTATPDA